MKITKEWLEQSGACGEGKQWFFSQETTRIDLVVKKLIVLKKFDWANWTLTHAMSHVQNAQYACFSAYQSLENFEKIYPNDKRPREAIEAALKWANDPTEANKSAVESAAMSVAMSVESVESAAMSAAMSVESAMAAAMSAAWSVESVAMSVESAAWSAAMSAARSVESVESAARSAAWKKLLIFGVKLLLGKVLEGAFLKWKK